MTNQAEDLLRGALSLDPEERAAVAEALLTSLDRPDPRMDALWSKEAEGRIAAFEAGRIRTVAQEEVFAEFDRA